MIGYQRQRGWVPDPPVLRFGSAAYEKGGQFEKALRTFQQQLDAKVDPDLITFSSLVSACVRAGALDLFHSVLMPVAYWCPALHNNISTLQASLKRPLECLM